MPCILEMVLAPRPYSGLTLSQKPFVGVSTVAGRLSCEPSLGSSTPHRTLSVLSQGFQIVQLQRLRQTNSKIAAVFRVTGLRAERAILALIGCVLNTRMFAMNAPNSFADIAMTATNQIAILPTLMPPTNCHQAAEALFFRKNMLEQS